MSPLALGLAAIVTNFVPNASFEAGIAPHGAIVSGPFCDESARPVVSLDETTAAHGRRSLKIDASRGGSYEFLTPDIPIPEGGARVTISAFAKTDRPAEFRLGAFGYDIDPDTGKELYTCPGKIVNVGTEWERFILERVNVDRKCSRLSVKIMGDGPVVLWLDGLQFEFGGDGKTFRPKAEVEAVWTADDCVFVRDADGACEGTAKLSVIDYEADRVESRTEAFPLAGNGLFTFDKPVEYGGRTIEPYPFDYAVAPSVPPYSGTGFALGGNGLTGVSVNRKTGEQVFTAPAGYSLSDYFRDIRRYGLRYVRLHDGNLQWRDMSPERGAYDWRVTDLVVKGCREAGLEAMFLFASHGIFINSPWDDGRFAEWHVRKDSAPAGKGPFGHRRYYLPRMDDWTNFIAAAVGRYGRDIHYWEIVNEPNILMASASNYACYARSAYDTVKRIKPDASVIGLCVTGDFGARPGSFLEQAAKTDAFDTMDVASVHPYDAPLDYGKRDAEAALAEIRATIEGHRPGLPLIQNELYYLYVEKPEGRQLPPRNLVRRYAIDMGMGLAVSAPLAFDSHLGADAGHRGTLLPGRVSVRFMPNALFVASAAFAHFLEGGKPDGKIAGMPEGVNGFAFRDRDGREVGVVWAREENDEGMVCRIPERAAVFDIFANAMNGRSVRLTRDPIYVVGDGVRSGLSFE